jgi:hypothetical protein
LEKFIEKFKRFYKVCNGSLLVVPPLSFLKPIKLDLSNTHSVKPLIESSNPLYIGCFNDNTDNTRDLSYLVNAYALPNKNNTIENCISICAKNGYTIAGLQYA